MAKPKRFMPVKTITLDFTDDGYPDFHAERRVNAPIGLMRRYFDVSGEMPEEEGRQILLELFPSWDFVDDIGKAIPHTVEGFDAIPADLIGAMHRRGFEALRNGAMPDPLDESSSPELSGLVEGSQPLETN